MVYSVAFLESQFEALAAHLFTGETEQAAFLLGKQVVAANSTRLLVRKVIPVQSGDIISASRIHMSIKSSAYRLPLKEADSTGQSFLFVHSHPSGTPDFSTQDDGEEEYLFRTAHVRIHHDVKHASLVFSDKHTFRGRVWHRDGTHSPIVSMRVIGNRFQHLYSEPISDVPLEYFDRQARAFTSHIQPILKRLNIGVVGVGGTGTAVCEQLIRLGIGRLTIIDNGLFEKSNVNRVYGSTVFDEKLPKVSIIARLAASIGLGTEVAAIQGHLSYRSVAEKLRECDVVFGCTDDEWGRSILGRLALFYYIPVFDMGVEIDTDGDEIVSVQGRVTTLMPGTACLYCRRRISVGGVRAEAVVSSNPDEAAALRKEGYLRNVAEPAPSVISFTTAIAATAVAEFLHRLTGFRGIDRQSSEVICFLDRNRVRTNSTPPSPDCLCADKEKWGRGDMIRFLDLSWRKE